MKRGGNLPRRTPLSPGTKRLRRAALNRQSELSRSAATRKPAKPLVSKPRPVTAEEKRARKVVANRSGGMCEGCDQRPATDWSHRVRRDVGPWCPSNGMHLCSDLSTADGRQGCHERAHANPLWARERGWILLTTDNPLTFPVRHARFGLVYLRADGSITPVEENAA